MEYADVDGVGFNMDIVPAAFDSGKGKSLERESVIAITNKGKKGEYNWVVSNPKAYREWFDQINAPFLAYNREERRASIFEVQKKFYLS